MLRNSDLVFKAFGQVVTNQVVLHVFPDVRHLVKRFNFGLLEDLVRTFRPGWARV